MTFPNNPRGTRCYILTLMVKAFFIYLSVNSAFPYNYSVEHFVVVVFL